jgi:hypothetical protein
MPRVKGKRDARKTWRPNPVDNKVFGYPPDLLLTGERSILLQAASTPKAIRHIHPRPHRRRFMVIGHLPSPIGAHGSQLLIRAQSDDQRAPALAQSWRGVPVPRRESPMLCLFPTEC